MIRATSSCTLSTTLRGVPAGAISARYVRAILMDSPARSASVSQGNNGERATLSTASANHLALRGTYGAKLAPLMKAIGHARQHSG